MSSTATVVLAASQWQYVELGLALLVFLAAAAFVGGWHR